MPRPTFPRLAPGAWDRVLRFISSFSERTQRQIRDLDERIRAAQERRAPLAERARLLGGAPATR